MSPQLSNTDLQILQLNCNSIRTKASELKIVLLEYKPHIVCLCETWLHHNFTPKFAGYTPLWKHRLGRQGGGLGLLIQNETNFQELELLPFPVGALEVQAVRVYLTQRPSLVIVNLYNPQMSVSLEELQHYVAQLGDNFLLIGDFNAHSPLFNSQTFHTDQTGKSIESLLQDSAICLINPTDMYTYIDCRSGLQSCLDLCLSSPNLAPVTTVSPLLDIGSDHLLLQIHVTVTPHTYPWYAQNKYKISSTTLASFKILYVLSTCLQPTDVDTLFEDFCTRFRGSADQCFGPPVARVNSTRRRTPWWSVDCHTAVLERCKAVKLFKTHPTQENFIAYKRLTAKARYVIMESKKSSLRQFIGSLDQNTPKSVVWRKIKAFKSSYTPSTYPLEENNVPILDPVTKANYLNDYFSGSPDPSLTGAPFRASVDFHCAQTTAAFNCAITETELFKAISNSKNSSPGQDAITNNMIRHCSPYYLQELHQLFNQSFLVGSVPRGWKSGTIIPIPKPLKPIINKQAYRPITLLSCVGKTLERVLKCRLDHYLESNSLLNRAQFGFRPKKSVADVVASLTRDIQQALSSKQGCVVLYIDLKGAFDSVWRHALLYKLSKLGISGSLLRWLRDYLHCRDNVVTLHGYFSQSSPSTSGVPQGAVLSPTLFNVMLADFPLQDGIQTYIFADDITIACSAPKVSQLQSRLQDYLNELIIWFDHWQFSINVDKTKVQYFTRKRNHPPVLHMNGVNLRYVKAQRLLGVILDAPRLTWKSHIDHLVADCCRRVDIMKSLSSLHFGASYNVLRTFYVAYVRTKLSYCAVAFSSASRTQMLRLHIIQNACLRLMLGARKSTPILSLEAESMLPPLHLYIERQNVLYYCKLQYSVEGNSAADKLLSDRSSLFVTNCVTTLRRFGVAQISRTPYSLTNSIPPWKNIDDYITLDLPVCYHTDQNFTTYVKTMYPDYVHIYTDGSKTIGDRPSVASAIYDHNTKRVTTWKLNGIHTVVAAELFALWMALDYLRLTNYTRCIIFTDSLTSLQIIRGDDCSHRAVTEKIRGILHNLNLDSSTILHWVKSHVGIHGNEVADKAANLGHKNLQSALYPLHSEEINCQVKSGFLTQWDRYWKDSCIQQQKGLFLRAIRPSLLTPTPVSTGVRKLDTAIFRLRLGHAGVLHYFYKIGKTDTSICSLCDEEGTIEHFLLYCDKYDQQRLAFFIDVANLTSTAPPFTLPLVLGAANFSRVTNSSILNLLGTFLLQCGKVEEL